ncbi:MAG: alpha/beta fold hydrolase [Bacteroidales bacterium]|nr:alpha/beta fold hydrolase [Bacteroidales bacterium]
MELFYRKLGEAGPPIIIVHGLYGASDNWISIARELADSYEVFMIDQRNHGDSPHDDVHSYDAMREDLREFMDKQQLERAILLGHSMGGKTVMSFALKYPKRVSSLIVVDIAPVPYKDLSVNSLSAANHSKMIDAMLALDLNKMESRDEVSSALALKIGSDRIRSFLLKNLTRNKEKKFCWKINLPALKANLDEILNGPDTSAYLQNGGVIGFPTIFIRGENSDYIKAEHHDVIQKLFPIAEIVSVPNSGHWVHAEQPDLLVKTVKYFLG